ncbi:type II toxin-antitoxin system HicA family toxin [Lamprobacter sp.]|uniref:type II toxin-antitoxin system HicA family toxin n=1 Tax=Lamprobacter sp. TaxID=3100796 RepID=UPI003A4E06A7
MTKLPSLTGKQVVDALCRADFQIVRIKGSHHFIRHADGRKTVVPVHSGESIGPGLLAKILRDCEISKDQFQLLIS